MKQEFNVEKPENIIEDWPGQYEVCSWLEYVVNIPYPLFIITTCKENGKSNANLCAWGFFRGEGEGFYSLFAIGKESHTYKNIMRDKEWCINIPSLGHKTESFNTIENNEIKDDEIKDSGLTERSSEVIDVPRIKESPISLECKFEWQKNLFRRSSQKIICGKIVHLAAEEKALNIDQKQRIEDLKIMYNSRSQLNPLSGESASSGVSILDSSFFDQN